MDTEDANTDTIVETDSSSDPVNVEPVRGDDGLVSTVEFQAVQEEKKTEQVEAETKTDDDSDDAEQNTSKDPEPEKQDFHEHPRFKELVDEKNTLKAEKDALRAEVEKLKTSVKPAEEKTEKPDYKYDWDSIDNDSLLEKMTDDPIGVLVDFGKIVTKNTLDKVRQNEIEIEKQTVRDRQKESYETYFKETEGAVEAWNNGSIREYMDTHPGETPISAHKAMTEDSRIQGAVEKAVKAEREKWNKELKLKGRASSPSIDRNPPQQPSGLDDELKNPDKYGGMKNVLVERLKRLSAS